MILAEIRAFGRSLVVQKRVIGALFMREFMTRWGRRNLGFAWLFAEPLVFAFPVIAMWSMIRSRVEHGLPMIAFVWSGYLPLLIFRHVTGHALYAIKSSAAMLYHRHVTPLDLFVGRQGLELVGEYRGLRDIIPDLLHVGADGVAAGLSLVPDRLFLYELVVDRCCPECCRAFGAVRDG